jgi:Family of unknown function (DUF5995)
MPTIDTAVAAAITAKPVRTIDDVIALWKVRKARETAWQNAEILWELKSIPKLTHKFLTSLDRLVSLSSKGLLAPAI